MISPSLFALLIALASGLAVGVQSSLNSAAGRSSGAILTGLLVNFFAGLAAGLILIVIYSRQDRAAFGGLQPATLGIMIAAGLLGIGIISGIAFSLPRVGVAAGLAAIIAGQMLVGLIVDSVGLAGAQPIPLTWMRLAGLGLLALGTWAILPKG